MKRSLLIFIILFSLLLPGCAVEDPSAQVVSTTRPVYDFTTFLCQNTDITVALLVTENLSCLHDYTLQVRQMRMIEEADMIIMSGADLEEFLTDVLTIAKPVIDTSENVPLLCVEDSHQHGQNHHHAHDPHIWLSISNARIMASNICNGLISQFPRHKDTLLQNLEMLQAKFDTLESYGNQAFSGLKSRDLITFHDGFGYFADYWDLNILHSLEEESGSEASASELKELIQLVREYQIPAIFTEANGSVSAANVIAAETGISIKVLNMGMSDIDYFESMYHNIDAIKEALG